MAHQCDVQDLYECIELHIFNTSPHQVDRQHGTSRAAQAFHFSFLSYRYEEHAGADVEAATATDDPDALEVIS